MLWPSARGAGVAKFDGENWTWYNKGNAPLPSNTIRAVAVDGAGNLWVGNNGGLGGRDGLVKFDGENWTVYDLRNFGLPSEEVQSLAVDAQGHLWIGTERGGLVQFDGENWTVYNKDNSPLPSNSQGALVGDGQGNMWIGSRDEFGLTKFDGESWARYNPSNTGVLGSWFGAMVSDAQGNLWFLSDGLVKFDGESWTRLANAPLPGYDERGLALDGRGNVWVGMNDWNTSQETGLAKFDGGHWTVYTASNSGLPSGPINALVVDTQDNVWIGTRGDGLVKFDGASWTRYTTENSGLPYDEIWALLLDGQGNLWIGMGGVGGGGRGFAKFDGETWTTHNSGLPNYHVTALFLDAQGNLWVGADGGVAKFDGEKWTGYGWVGVRVTSIAIDAQGNPWARYTTFPDGNGGLVKYDGEHWTDTGYCPGHCYTGIYDSPLLLDERGNLWAATGDGLTVYREGGVILGGEVTAVEEDKAEVPSAFSLSQNHPNPFNPMTTITYDLPRASHVSLTVYTITGQKVAVLVDAYQDAGHHTAYFDGSSLATGVYLYRFEAEGFAQTKCMVLLR